MNSIADKLKEKKITDDETEAYHSYMRQLKIYQKVNPLNETINNMIKDMEMW